MINNRSEQIFNDFYHFILSDFDVTCRWAVNWYRVGKSNVWKRKKRSDAYNCVQSSKILFKEGEMWQNFSKKKKTLTACGNSLQNQCSIKREWSSKIAMYTTDTRSLKQRHSEIQNNTKVSRELLCKQLPFPLKV